MNLGKVDLRSMHFKKDTKRIKMVTENKKEPVRNEEYRNETWTTLQGINSRVHEAEDQIFWNIRK